MTWKVYKKNTNAFHVSMIKYSRGTTYFVCLELDCLGVDIPFFLSPLLGRGTNSNAVLSKISDNIITNK
jgi:hypothetical protein